MTDARVTVPPAELPAALQGARVTACEVVTGAFPDTGYIVLHFDNGATLYADAPTLYRTEVRNHA